MPVWLYQGPLQGTGEKYLATDDAVCVEQFVDGPGHAFEQGQGMSAPAVRAGAAKWPEKAANQNQYVSEFGEKRNRLAPENFFVISNRASGGYSDLP